MIEPGSFPLCRLAEMAADGVGQGCFEAVNEQVLAAVVVVIEKPARKAIDRLGDSEFRARSVKVPSPLLW